MDGRHDSSFRDFIVVVDEGRIEDSALRFAMANNTAESRCSVDVDRICAPKL